LAYLWLGDTGNKVSYLPGPYGLLVKYTSGLPAWSTDSHCAFAVAFYGKIVEVSWIFLEVRGDF